MREWFGDGKKSTKAQVELFEGTQRNAYDNRFSKSICVSTISWSFDQLTLVSENHFIASSSQTSTSRSAPVSNFDHLKLFTRFSVSSPGAQWKLRYFPYWMAPVPAVVATLELVDLLVGGLLLSRDSLEGSLWIHSLIHSWYFGAEFVSVLEDSR